MADPKIKIKRSSVAGKIPTPDQVPLGELALNTYDGKLFASKNVGIGTTVIAVNPWSVGVGTDTYNTYFTAGSVGIGTTLPTSNLHVIGDARITGILTIGQGSITLDGSTNFLGLGTATPTGDENSLSLFSRPSDPPGETSFRISGPLHKIIFQGLDVGLLNGTYTSGRYGLSASNTLSFFTSSSEKATITSGGNVGIASTLPTSKLDVAGDVKVSGVVTATSFVGNGSGLTGIPKDFTTYTAGIATSKSVGINTTNLDDSDLTGIGNSFQGLYIGNGMIIVDNVLNGNHYIGTNFNGLMAGPVTINGSLTIDGNYVVV